MSSGQICSIMKKCIRKRYPDSVIISIPVADGGEGSVDSFLSSVGGEKTYLTVKGPYCENVPAFYGILKDGTAVIEMAACAGLPLVEGNLHPDLTTTYGVGQLIVHAASHGHRKIIVGLGGSCTNDAGTGAAAAAGVKFYDKDGTEFLPVGGTLADIEKIDLSSLDSAVRTTEIIAMCDIDNPLYGPNGAACVFGPQKGADAKKVKALDEGLVHLSQVVQKELGVDISEMPGSGAAGGM